MDYKTSEHMTIRFAGGPTPSDDYACVRKKPLHGLAVEPPLKQRCTGVPRTCNGRQACMIMPLL